MMILLSILWGPTCVSGYCISVNALYNFHHEYRKTIHHKQYIYRSYMQLIYYVGISKIKHQMWLGGHPYMYMIPPRLKNEVYSDFPSILTIFFNSVIFTGRR